MSRSGEMDKTIQGLLPLETYRSPWFPTRRLGQDALLAVAAPFRETGTISVAPSVWFAVTPDFSTMLAFARTGAVTPVEDFRPALVETRSSSLRPREAHALLWRLSDSLWSDFFAGREAASSTRSEVTSAVDATVPARLQPWLHLCCQDFFDWLGQAAPDPANP
jgi:hypothetical protein